MIQLVFWMDLKIPLITFLPLLIDLLFVPDVKLIFSYLDWCQEGVSKFPIFRTGAYLGKKNQFKSLGIHFSLITRSSCLFDLNYKVKLKQIDGSLNCWRARNLSMIGKICVIKALLLPQLLYLFSVLCIKIPKIFLKKLDKTFYKFIWNVGNDRVKRVYIRNHFNHCGLRMIDTIFHWLKK